jgi:hypothetical protein
MKAPPPSHLPKFQDWLVKYDDKAEGTAKTYARFLTRCAEHYGEQIDEQHVRSAGDVDQIIRRVSAVVAKRDRWAPGTFNTYDPSRNLIFALQAYARFVTSQFPDTSPPTPTQVAAKPVSPLLPTPPSSSSSAPNRNPGIQHQELFEAYYKEGGRVSIDQYLSSLRRASRLLGEAISPALLPNVGAVEGVLKRLRQGQFKDEKFGPVGTALRRYAETVERNFNQSFHPAKDVPTDELPARMKVEVSRVVRDVGLAKAVKELHGHECQICGLRLELSRGQFYSEGHHLKPLGQPHNGPDVEGNVLCVCPNCHAKLDFAAIKIGPTNLRTAPGHSVRQEFIDYHNGLCA